MLTGVSGEGRSYREQNHRAGISQMEERVMQILKTGQGIHRGVSGGKKKGAEIRERGGYAENGRDFRPEVCFLGWHSTT
jgi:hypothetical protein